MLQRSSHARVSRSKKMSATSTALMTAEELLQLAVEVLRPSDRSGKVRQKISRWLHFGVKQLWIVDPKHSTVAVYRSESDITTFSGSDYLEAQDLFPGLRIPLDNIFGPAPAIK